MGKLSNHERIKIYNEKHLDVSKRVKVEDYPTHWHSFFEIEIILYGAGRCIINDVEFDITPTSVYLLSTTDFHRVTIDEQTKILNISFDEGMIDEKTLLTIIHPSTNKNYVLTKEEHQRIVTASELLEHECKTNGECQKQLLEYILNCVLKKNKPIYSAQTSSTNYTGIKKAITYMEIHFKENITLQTLAKEAGYHPAYFSELFKKTTGETYISTLNKLRTGYARTLLANGFSVSQSCFMSGFSSLSNFGTTFKKICNMSPKEYAKNSIEKKSDTHISS